MLFLYILLGLLGLLTLVLVVPVYGRVIYDKDLKATVWVLGIPITLLPQEEKTLSPPTSKAKNNAVTQKKRNPQEKPSKWQELTAMFREDGPAATIHYLCELAKLAGQAVGHLLKAVTVDRLSLELLIATGDPADTAVRYGQVCSALYPALAGIESRVGVRRRYLRVEPNFLQEKSDIALDVRLHIRVWQALWAVLVLLIKFILMKETDETVNYKEVIHNGK